jgi:tetratricopeptide (TPR) repeat protein
MSFLEFLKAILVVGWILIGFWLFWDDINAEYPSVETHSQPAPSASTHTETIIEKTIVVSSSSKASTQTSWEVQQQKLTPSVTKNDDAFEKDDTTNVMKHVTFFKQPLTIKSDFYTQLTPDLQTEFKRLFIDANPDHLVKDLVYTIKGDNADFFQRVYQHLYDYRKIISQPLLEQLHRALISYTKDAESHTLLNEAAIRTAYTRRQDAPMLTYAETLARQDTNLHKNVLKTKNTYVYSYVRIAILLEKQGRIDEALDVVETALALNLDDRTVGQFIGRKERLLSLRPQPEETTESIDTKEPETTKDEEEAVVDEAALESIQIFKTTIKARTGFYEELTPTEQAEFRRYYMEEGPERLTKDIVYVLKGNNDQFFTRVFNYIYRYRKLISNSLLTKIYDELMTFTNGDPATQSILTELAIRVAYFRRKDAQMLETAYQWSLRDVKLHRDTIQSKNTYVYSFTRLAIIYEKKKMFKEAIELVNDALKRGLNDKTRTGYEGRLVRLNKKIGAMK